MNTDTKILFETDLKFTHENKTLDFRANFPIPRTWLLIWDQIIQYQYRAFFETRFFDTFTTRSISHVHCTMYMCYWKYFMTKFAELFFRSEYRYWDFFQRPNMFWYWYRAFSVSQIFRYRYWYPQKIEKVSRLWHHTRSKHSPVQRSKENPNDIGYQRDHVDPRANLANGHVHWRCQYCKFVKVFKTTFLLKTWFDLKVDFRSNYCASYLWQSSDPLALSQQIHRKGWW